MPAVSRLYQLFARVEPQEGVAASAGALFAAGNANLLVSNPQFTPQKENFDRTNINRPSVSPLIPLAGLTFGTQSFDVELSTASGTGLPGWSLLLEAAGNELSTLYAVKCSAVAGGGSLKAIGAGERITQASTNASGYLVHTLRESDTHALIRLDADSATANNSGVWTAAESGGTFTPDTSAPTDVGYCWTPASLGYQVQTLSGTPTSQIEIGETVTGDTTGAVGVVVQTITTSDTELVIRRLDGYFANGENVTFSGGETESLAATWSQRKNKAINIGLVEDGRRKHGVGCRGSYSIAARLGEAAIMSFSMTGLYNGAIDGGAVGGVAFTAQTPPVTLGVGMTIGTENDDVADLYTPRLQSVSYDHGTEVAIPRDATESSGVYDAAFTTGRSSSGSLVVGVVPTSVFDWSQLMEDGTPFTALTTWTSPVDANKKLRLEAPAAVITAESPGDESGFGTSDYTLQLGSRSANAVDIDDAELILSYQHTALPS